MGPMAQTYDAIVVGLGAMGSAALYQLRKRGLRVMGLEAFSPGHQLGSFHGESRIIRMAYFEHPKYVPLLRSAYELWAELEAASGESLLRVTGGLMIGTPSSELVAGARDSAQQHGLEHTLLTAEEVQRRYPAFHLANGEVALYEPRAGYLRPEQCIESFLRLATAETHFDEPVSSWRAVGSDIEVHTDVATYTSRYVVFTPGARVNRLLGDRIPLVVAERIPVFWMEPTRPELFVSLPVYIWEIGPGQHFYGFPHVEWPGVKVARHHNGVFVDPDSVDRIANEHDEQLLRNAIERRLPELNGRVLSTAVCVYENSPDQHFLIDRLGDHPNVIYAAGFSGHGFKFASVVGEILADLVIRGEATRDADFLRGSRVTVSS
jgi:sarcosine oxidase